MDFPTGGLPTAVKGPLRAPAAWLLERSLRLSSGKLAVAVVYHRVGDPPGLPEREIVPALSVRLFHDQLRLLSARFRIVRPSDVLDAATSRRPGQPFPLAITFDDDIESHAGVAAPILRRLGLPAGFFLCGASLAAPYEFWWERLQRAVDTGVAPRVLATAAVGSGSSIHEMAARIENLDPAERRGVAARLQDEVGPPPDDSGLRAAAVRALSGDGFEIGFHTLAHDPLVGLDDEALDRALTEGRDVLAEVAGEGSLRMIAYPHGRADQRVADAARRAGYTMGFTTSWDAISSTDDPLLLGRVEPSFESASHLALRLARRLAAAARS